MPDPFHLHVTKPLLALVNVISPVFFTPFGTLRAQLAALVATINRTTVVPARAASVPFVTASVIPAAIITAVIAATSTPAVVAVAAVTIVMPAAMAAPLLRLTRRRLVTVMADKGHRADAEQPKQGQTDYKLLHIASFPVFYLLSFTMAKIGNKAAKSQIILVI